MPDLQDLLRRVEEAYALARGSWREEPPPPHWDDVPDRVRRFLANLIQAHQAATEDTDHDQ